jgi:flagellar biosynthesis regulator FlbT
MANIMKQATTPLMRLRFIALMCLPTPAKRIEAKAQSNAALRAAISPFIAVIPVGV